MREAVFSAFDAAERQNFVRTYTDSAERWLRHLVHLTLGRTIGPNYITQGPWKKDLIQRISTKIHSTPGIFTREVDATTFDQLVDIVCHPKHWDVFKDALARAYPDGVQEARTFLTRIQDIRNNVAHLRACSVRELEQALCYSNDLADSIKAHFQATDMAKEFYVPVFVSFSDSLGNAGHFRPSEWHFRGEDLSTNVHKRLFPGDVLTLELDVDPSFDPSTYSVTWRIKTHPHDKGDGKKAVIPITEAHIGQRMEIQFKLVTTNSWHRSSDGSDDIIDLHYRVLPSVP
jgi:hypothetical protein